MTMEPEELEKLKFPLGRFTWEGEWSEERKNEWIASIQGAPEALAKALDGLGEAQLDTPYRPEGWTVRQVVHHLADSHLNSVTRFKLALTEDHPVIKPYREDLWAELADARSYPVAASLRMLEGIHDRWTALLRTMTEEDYLRTFFHPESQADVSLRRALANYAWHGEHHTAQILELRRRQSW
ncbi:YfiT family bacillithiol transferase [Gorillibacterium sp. sgz5001074]|uniref:YfiT family bacillithiol transferase n=1 Tax=Gorillibacterium sp. sgz5001074 TaxID=3446695 RepID=UPI003F66B60F